MSDGVSDSAPDPATRHRSARRAVSVEFVLMGAVAGGWAARIPDVRGQIGLDDAQWGLAAAAAATGSLLSLVGSVVLVSRAGPRRLGMVGAGLLLAVAAAIGWTTRPGPLIVALVLQGVATGLLGPAMNAQAAEVERRYRRRIMSTFHACFSAGQLTGGVLGIIAARIGAPPGAQFTATSMVLLVLLLLVVRDLPADHRPSEPGRVAPPVLPWRRRLTPQLVLLSVMALLCLINEGVSVQWSAQFTAVSLGAGPSWGAATFTAYSVAMAVSRSVGDRIVDRFGERRFIQLSEAAVAVGMAAAVFGGTVATALIGFVLVGLGSACVVPVVMQLAARQPGLVAGQAVSVVSLGQWPAFLIGPTLVGLLAQLIDLRWALLLVPVVALTIVVSARMLRIPPVVEHVVRSS